MTEPTLGRFAGVQLWGWDTVTANWVKILVNSDGKLIVDPSELFENPPTNGETAKAPQSDWAYDHWQDPDAHHDAFTEADHLAIGNSAPHHAEAHTLTSHSTKARSELTGVGANDHHSSSKLVDADADTKVDVEESADEDIIRMDVAGVEAFNLDKTGILSLVKQSGCYVSCAYGQYLQPWAQISWLLLNTEAYDYQNEFDNTVKTGTATATTANHLIDTINNQFVPADVGRFIWNTTDNTYARITAYNSASDVTLDTNIMVNGEGYKLYDSMFTALKAGVYLIGVYVQLNGNSVDGAYLEVLIHRVNVAGNLTPIGHNVAYASGNNQYTGCLATMACFLDTGEGIAFSAEQNTAVAKQLFPRALSVNAFIAKIA